MFNIVSFSNRSFFKQIPNVETQDSNWFKLVQQTFLHQYVVVVPFLAFERETSKWRTVWVDRWLQGAVDRAAEGWQGEGVAMEKGIWAGACSIIPASVTWLLGPPELRNSPNMNNNRRNISRWRTATKTQIIICYYKFIGWVIIDREQRKSHGSWGPGVFNLNTLTFLLNFGR